MNTKLSNIKKFSYLKGKLHGQAQSAISGLTLSNENYDVAVDILKERFIWGRTNRSKYKCLTILYSCEQCTQTDPKTL
jgi:hypothetical protein